MEEIALPSKECRGVDMPDILGNPSGLQYKARRPGFVEVDNPAHARYIRDSIGQRFNRVIAIRAREGWSCECGRENFVFTERCGKCGAERPELDLAA